MIISCPECQTRYVVPDAAIGIDGRTVRCAKCKHSWYQEGPEVKSVQSDEQIQENGPETDEIAPANEQMTAQKDETPASFAETDDENGQTQTPETASSEVAQNAPDDRSEIEQEAAAEPSIDHWRASDSDPADEYAEQVEEGLPPPSFADDNAGGAAEPPPAPSITEQFYDDPQPESQFDHQPPFRPRLNTLKLWTFAAAAFALIAMGATVAVNYVGVPSWFPVQQPTWGLAEPNLEFDFPREQMQNRTLPDGTSYLGLSGTITNTGPETTQVPSLRVILRDERHRAVFDWEISPPKSQLAPGETMTVSEAATNVPRAAKKIEIGWKPN